MAHQQPKYIGHRIRKACTQLKKTTPFKEALPYITFVRDTNHLVDRIAIANRTIFYNSTWLNQFTDEDLSFIIAHEILHYTQYDIDDERRDNHHDKSKWNVASDIEINNILIRMKFQPIKECIIREDLSHLVAEQIYDTMEH